MNIAVVGACGKLGSAIVNELQKVHTVFKVDSTLNNSLFDLDNFDAVIDASCAQGSIFSAQYCSNCGAALLVACTGHTQEQLQQIDTLCHNNSYCVCPNLSVGVLWVMQALTHLNLLKSPYISITETHHISKKDSPSGTALALKKQIAEFGKLNADIVSIRHGDAVGTHTINITLPSEEITITHKALSREVFAVGARRLIEKLVNLPKGKYTLLDVLGGDYEN